MTQRSWFIREFKEEDLPGLLEFGKIIFPEAEPNKFDQSFWEWEFLKNPAGPAKLWLAAEPDGTIVGHYAVIPAHWSMNKKDILGSIVVDVMTHPDYRQQGMFVEIGRKAMEEAGKEGILFSYGFPVRPEVMPGHLKVGWENLSSLPVWVRPLRPHKFVEHYLPWRPFQRLVSAFLNPLISLYFKRKKDHTSSEIQIEKIDHFDKGAEKIWPTLESHLIQKRDQTFLNWRYFGNSHRNYEVYQALRKEEIVGYIALRRLAIFEFQCMALVDILVKPDEKEALDLLIKKAVFEASQDSTIDMVATMINPGNPCEALLRKNRFLNSGKEFWFILRLNGEIEDREKIKPSPNWFLMWGDIDVI